MEEDGGEERWRKEGRKDERGWKGGEMEEDGGKMEDGRWRGGEMEE